MTAVPAWARVLVASATAAVAFVAAGTAAALPPGFQESVAIGGLANPTTFRFTADGRVFVAEKSGVIKVFDSLSDPTPTVFTDLSTNVYNFWDRGLLGMTLDPQFSAGRPYVYVLYAYDAAIGGVAPRWGTPGVLSDPCPTPPGPTADGCLVSARLARLTANGNVAVPGSHATLIEDWCQQYPSHSIGSLEFGADGALYVSGGDGASFNFVDWGQDGSPVNPCGDPPGGVGATLSPPTAQGGALRSQDLRTSGDPVSLDGTILRVDPTTGNGLLDNPLAASSDPNARRIVAQGFRNPFRFTIRPGTSEVWAGDVGWNDWEEINRLGPLTSVGNFGWPCYEGNGRQSGYDNANLSICENLYGQAGAVTAPYYTYSHAAKVVTGETCPTGSSSIAGLEFYDGGSFPAGYDGALFFADYSRNCIWVMFRGGNGLPDPATRATFAAPAAGPVDLRIGPGGDLYYADLSGGTIRRIRYLSSNLPPTAVISANPTSGPAPLTVQFDGSGSSDPDADAITYAWDLDGDGAFDDSTAATPSRVYPSGTVTARLRVTDVLGATGTASVVINSGNAPPAATISTPAPSLRWKVDDTISFAGSATDPQDGALPASRLTWSLDLRHCSSVDDCHTHSLQQFVGVSGGTFTAPDHEYPSHLLLTLTATDLGGASDTETVRLDPQTVDLTFASQPSGLQLTVGSSSGTTPFTRTAIVGSTNSVSAPTPQTLGASSYRFVSWSDGGAQAHSVIAPSLPTTYTAAYETTGSSGLVAAYSADAGSGTTLADSSGNGNNGTIAGAGWSAAGRFGGALSFDGLNDLVTVADASSLDLTNGMTLEAWVNPSPGGYWRTVLLKEQPGQLAYALYSSTDSDRPSGHVYVGGDVDTRSSAALPANAWTHLTATYDGAILRLYVNGSLASSRAVSGAIASSVGALRIGGNLVWGEYFGGRIDEIRIYSRALSAAEIQNDMNTSVGAPPPPPPPDTQPPTAPTLGVQGGLSSATLTWTASTDNVGVDRYEVHRSTIAAFLPSAANRIAQLSGTAHTDAGLAPGVYFYKVVVYDAAGNSAQSNEASGVVTGDTTAPTVSITAPAGGTTVFGSVSVTASASDDVGVAGVQFKVDGQNVGAEDTSVPYSVSWDTAGATNGPHELTAEARDAAGNRTTSSIVQVSVDNTAPPPAAGLVAAYSFNEGAGTTLNDRSGTGNHGSVSGATWAAAGRYGGALAFDGVNDQVTVADATSLDLTRMTLEAWVLPTALGDWRTVLLKEQPGQLAYALYGNTDTGRPSGHVFVGGDRDVRGTAPLSTGAWTHLAATYDGATLRLYVNGIQASSLALAGSILTSSGALRLGGNTVWGEWFAGRLDDVRIYNRALSAAEVQADMNRAITP